LRRTILIALLALALCAPFPSRAATPLVIEVILSLTGSGAFLGTTEAGALKSLAGVVNAQGGIAGQPIEFSISDDQSNPVLSVQIANQLIAKHVTVFLGSSTSSVCRSVAPLVEKSGPLEYCFSPGMRAAAGSYVFAAGAASSDIGVVETRYFRERGLTRLAMLSSTDSSGDQDHTWFLETLHRPENKDVQLVADERFNPSDVSVAAQMANIKAARPQALIVKATGPAFGTVLRAFSDAGLDVPISASGSNLITSQLAQYKPFAPKNVYFAVTRGILPDPSLPKGPLRDAQATYFSALSKAGIATSNNAVLAWDPAWILVGALRKLGPNAGAEQLHDYIEGLHGWSGVSGTYDFRTGDQRGLGPDALLMYHWETSDNSVSIASKSGGHVR
jgi:branched-chain amino acid transport system substrate-binding protein